MPRKRGRRALLRDPSRLDVSGRSANPLTRGVGSDEGEKEKNPDTRMSRGRRNWAV